MKKGGEQSEVNDQSVVKRTCFGQACRGACWERVNPCHVTAIPFELIGLPGGIDMTTHDGDETCQSDHEEKVKRWLRMEWSEVQTR